MASDPRVPDVQLMKGETVELIAKRHWVIYFRLVHILVIPLIFTILRAKNAMMIVTNRRVVIQSGVISKDQTKIDLLKIQDVNCGVRGLLGRLVSAGWIQLETAGRTSGMGFAPVAGHQAIADRISELIDNAQQADRMAMAQAIADGVKAGAQPESTT